MQRAGSYRMFLCASHLSDCAARSDPTGSGPAEPTPGAAPDHPYSSRFFLPPRFLTVPAVALFLSLTLLPLLALSLKFVFQPGAEFSALFLSSRQLGLLIKSILLALGTSVAAVSLGIGLAFLTCRTDLPGKNAFRYILLLPLLIPPHLHAIAWLKLLEVDGALGAASLFLRRSISSPDALGLIGAIAILTLAYYPLVILFGIGGLASLDQGLEEAAWLHREDWVIARRIHLRLLRPHILAAGLIVFLFSLSEYGVPALLGVNVYPVEIFIQFSAFYSPQGAFLMTVPALVLAMVLVLLQQSLQRGRPSMALEHGGRRLIFRLGRARWPVCVGVGIVVLVSLLIPMGTFVISAAELQRVLQALAASYRAMLLTVCFSVMSATAALAVALVIASLLENSRPSRQRLLGILIFLPLAIPSTLLGVGLISLLNSPATQVLYTSFPMLVIADMGRFSPLAVMALSPAMCQVSPALKEAAALSGRSWTRTMWKVILPLISPGISTAWIVVYVLSLGELGTTLLVIPPGIETLPLRIYNLMHYGVYPIVAVLSLALVGLGFLPIVAVVALGKRMRVEP